MLKQTGDEGQRVLLVVGAQPTKAMRADIAAGRLPRRDYDALRAELGADTLYLGDLHATRLGRVLMSVAGHGGALALMAAARRGNYDVIYTDSERVGLPLAMLLKLGLSPRGKPRHVMLTHYLSSFKKRLWFRLGAASHVDQMIVHSSAQREVAVSTLRMPPERVSLLPYFADAKFWNGTTPDGSTGPESEPLNYICSVGLEFRDYPTLVEAVRDLPINVRIAAASNWSHHSPLTRDRSIPRNIYIRRYEPAGLRRLYAGARFVVLPLLDVDNQAGITTLLEAMSMGKAIIVTRSRGQTDVIRGWQSEGSAYPEPVPGFLAELGLGQTLGQLPTGLYVPPGDAEAMRTAIQLLLNNPALAEELGRNARQVAEACFSLEAFTRRFAAVIRTEPTTSLGQVAVAQPAEA